MCKGKLPRFYCYNCKQYTYFEDFGRDLPDNRRYLCCDCQEWLKKELKREPIKSTNPATRLEVTTDEV